jgi:predicted transglutaminase-like protease
MNKVYIVVEKCEGDLGRVDSEICEIFGTYKDAVEFAKSKKRNWKIEKKNLKLSLNIDYDVYERILIQRL